MTLGGFCLSHTGFDTALISAGGQLQDSGSYPIQGIDPKCPDIDSLQLPFMSHVKTHSSPEAGIIAVSTQTKNWWKYQVLASAKHTNISNVVDVVEYFDAYVAGLKAKELTSNPFFLFIEFTEMTLCAQFLEVCLEGMKRCLRYIYFAAISSSVPFIDFFSQLLKWSETHGRTLTQVVLLDPPYDIPHADLQAVQPPCPIIRVNGTDLARYAANYALINREDIGPPGPEDDLGFPMSPATICVVAAEGPTAVIIPKHGDPDDSGEIAFTTSEDNQTQVVVELAFGNHEHRPEDQFIFARIQFNGLHPMPKGATTITLSLYAELDLGMTFVIVQDLKGMAPNLQMQVRLPSPFDFTAFDALKLFGDNKAIEIFGPGALPAL